MVNVVCKVRVNGIKFLLTQGGSTGNVQNTKFLAELCLINIIVTLSSSLTAQQLTMCMYDSPEESIIHFLLLHTFTNRNLQWKKYTRPNIIYCKRRSCLFLPARTGSAILGRGVWYCPLTPHKDFVCIFLPILAETVNKRLIISGPVIAL